MQAVLLAELAGPRLVDGRVVRSENVHPADHTVGGARAPAGAMQHPQRAAEAAVGEPAVVSVGVVVRVLPRRAPPTHARLHAVDSDVLESAPDLAGSGGMGPDLVELLDALRRSRRPELLRIVESADLDAEPPAPEPDVVEPYRWFLARLGDGVKLTGAGYLPPALVVETMRALGWDADWIGTGNREDITRPVAELRDTARRLGLVRVHRKELRPTTAGRRLADDPVGLWRHLGARLPLGRGEADRIAGLLWLLGVAAGRPHPEEVVAVGMNALGWESGETGKPLDRRTAFLAVRDTTWTVFDRLGVLGTWRDRDRPPTPSAIALARAALLHEEPPAPARSVPAVELTVTLADVDPPVWRRLVVPERTTLRDLHGLLQAAMGWQDAHLWLFEVDGVRYGDVEDMDDLGDPRAVIVGSMPDGTVFRYDYDFGDGWEHDVRVEGRRTAEAPACVDGARACPPEDCGGPPGYAEMLTVLADPRHPDHADVTGWLGGPFYPDDFDPGAATRRMRNRVRRRAAA
ncbi:pRiA4b ORF-3-like protein [Blastococcus colisei]|uniref:PRiA4b ORF-3-like protein n=1 Tax=Blastococcus colisei TaxID=1564162 RepID=A0A543PDJ9_9ACTN|nr:plasmid pRiA4b ORF-3 family protein [Blastococcus colisei]TQN42143.1 pRiA4b ORF-3-like protein [Blastococcus colisei]